MHVNNEGMPNPFLIIGIFALTLAVVRVITIFAHEMGHALVGMLFLKGDFDVYIGSYGDPDKGYHFKIGRITFHFIYEPFSVEKGVFRSELQDTSVLRDFLITLAGPVASLVTGLLYFYIAVFSPLPEVVKISFYIFTGSSFLDFWYNIKPDKTAIVLHNNKLVYNDGYMLQYRWAQLRNKKLPVVEEERTDIVLEAKKNQSAD